jgi:hypothetical protein
MQGHFQDVKQHVEKSTLSNSHAKHFGDRVPSGAKSPTPGMQRSVISCSVIWKGGPISSVKSFGKIFCRFCNCEHMAIVKAEFKSPKGLINSRSELHGACCHVPRFHRLLSSSYAGSPQCATNPPPPLQPPTCRPQHLTHTNPSCSCL